MFAFEKTSPESQGIPSEAIRSFAERLAKMDAIHSFMLVRHDKLIAEAWWKPFKKEYKHELFSCSKSFVSIACGIAQGEGLLSLNDRIVSFFPDKMSGKVSERMKKATIKNLLTMSSGHNACPLAAGTVSLHQDWVKAFLESELAYEPGEKFVYNSAATYMVSAILRRVTGRNVLDYLNEKLLPFIGINADKWDCCPAGTNIGGWGFWLKTEDMLRFCRLLKNQGNWDGKQLVPADYIAEATSFQIDNSSNNDPDWKIGYGYQFWQTTFNSFRGDGACGQYMLVMPEQDLYMAVTSGVANMQQILTAFWETVIPALQANPLPENPESFSTLTETLSALEHKPLANDLRFVIPDAEYSIDTNSAGLQKLKINPTANGCEITFFRTDNSFEKMRADYGRHTHNILQMLENEMRIIEASCAWSNENTLVIQAYSVETPYRDRYILTFSNDEINLARESNFSFLHAELPTVHGTEIKN